PAPATQYRPFQADELFCRLVQRKHPARACPAAQAAVIPPVGQLDPAPTTSPAQNPALREPAGASAMLWPRFEHGRPECQLLRGWPTCAVPKSGAGSHARSWALERWRCATKPATVPDGCDAVGLSTRRDD